MLRENGMDAMTMRYTIIGDSGKFIEFKGHQHDAFSPDVVLVEDEAALLRAEHRHPSVLKMPLDVALKVGLNDALEHDKVSPVLGLMVGDAYHRACRHVILMCPWGCYWEHEATGNQYQMVKLRPSSGRIDMDGIAPDHTRYNTLTDRHAFVLRSPEGIPGFVSLDSLTTLKFASGTRVHIYLSGRNMFTFGL